MKITSIITYCITFLIYSIFFGGLYEKFHLSYKAALTVLVVITFIMISTLIFDYFFYNKIFSKDEENTLNDDGNKDSNSIYKKKIS